MQTTQKTSVWTGDNSSTPRSEVCTPPPHCVWHRTDCKADSYDARLQTALTCTAPTVSMRICLCLSKTARNNAGMERLRLAQFAQTLPLPMQKHNSRFQGG